MYLLTSGFFEQYFFSDRVSCTSGWQLTHYIENDDLEPSASYPLELGFQACTTIPFQASLGMELRALCMLGKQSTHWATSPAPLNIFLNIFHLLYARNNGISMAIRTAYSRKMCWQSDQLHDPGVAQKASSQPLSMEGSLSSVLAFIRGWRKGESY